MTKLNKDIPKMGFIWVYLNKYENGKKPSFFARMINKEQFTEQYSKYECQACHVGISCGGFQSIEACIPKIKLIDDVTNEYKGRYALLVRPRIKDYDSKRKNVCVKALSRCNLKYGFFSLLWFKVNNLGILKKRNIFARVGGMFCSYLAAWAINEYFPSFSEIPPENTVPAEFLTDKYDIIWQGWL